MAIIVAFGTSPHTQPLGLEPGTCPACGASGYREIVRRYRVAHVFFFPMFVTHEEVIATCASCGAPERVIAPEGSPPPRAGATASAAWSRRRSSCRSGSRRWPSRP